MSKFSIEENKMLCERYPYLIPRSVWDDKISEDYDYSFIHGDYELPEGWIPLFIQMCEDIREPLIKAKYLKKFRFSQIKEKYNTMRCYNFGAPDEVQEIISNYEHISQFVCQKCGRPADIETTGWITSYCNECADNIFGKDFRIKEDYTKLEFDPIRRVSRLYKGEWTEHSYDCSDIWNRLYSIDPENIEFRGENND